MTDSVIEYMLYLFLFAFLITGVIIVVGVSCDFDNHDYGILFASDFFNFFDDDFV